MKILLVGPTTGLAMRNYASHMVAAETLSAAGHDVLTVHMLPDPAWDVPAAWQDRARRLIGWALAEDVRSVVLLPGWHASRTARVVKDLATGLGWGVSYAGDVPAGPHDLDPDTELTVASMQARDTAAWRCMRQARQRAAVAVAAHPNLAWSA